MTGSSPTSPAAGRDCGGGGGAGQQREAGQQDERSPDDQGGGRGADDRPDHGNGADDGRPRQRGGRSPAGGHRAASVAGVGTCTSTASTMERPVTCVIQSSGRTVTRCER